MIYELYGQKWIKLGSRNSFHAGWISRAKDEEETHLPDFFLVRNRNEPPLCRCGQLLLFINRFMWFRKSSLLNQTQNFSPTLSSSPNRNVAVSGFGLGRKSWKFRRRRSSFQSCTPRNRVSFFNSLRSGFWFDYDLFEPSLIVEIRELGVAGAKEVATEEEDGDEGFDLGWLPAFPHVLIASMSNFLFGYHIGLFSLSGYIYLCICMYWCVHACIRFICN